MIGLEPTHLTALTPKVSLSTNSNTLALCFVYGSIHLSMLDIDVLYSFLPPPPKPYRRMLCISLLLRLVLRTWHHYIVGA